MDVRLQKPEKDWFLLQIIYHSALVKTLAPLTEQNKWKDFLLVQFTTLLNDIKCAQSVWHILKYADDTVVKYFWVQLFKSNLSFDLLLKFNFKTSNLEYLSLLISPFWHWIHKEGIRMYTICQRFRLSVYWNMHTLPCSCSWCRTAKDQHWNWAQKIKWK